jgi:hypothetical protein
MNERSESLTREQRQARERWQARWNLPIIVAAVLPLFVTSPKSTWVEVVVGVGSWLVFVVDLVVQRRIVAGYLHERRGRFDLAIVLLMPSCSTCRPNCRPCSCALANLPRPRGLVPALPTSTHGLVHH